MSSAALRIISKSPSNQQIVKDSVQDPYLSNFTTTGKNSRSLSKIGEGGSSPTSPNEIVSNSNLKFAVYQSNELTTEAPRRVLCSRMERAERQNRLMNQAKGMQRMISTQQRCRLHLPLYSLKQTKTAGADTPKKKT